MREKRFPFRPIRPVVWILLLLLSIPLDAAAIGLREIEITPSGYKGSERLANFPVLVRLSEGLPGFRYADCAPGGADLLFFDGQKNPLRYEIDTWDPEGVSLIWVTLPELTSTTRFTLNFGNRNATGTDYARNGVAWDQAGYAGVWHFSDLDEAGTTPDSTANRLDATANKREAASLLPDGIVGSCVRNTTTTGSDGAGFLTASYDHLALGSTFTLSFWCRRSDFLAPLEQLVSRKSVWSGDGFAVEMGGNVTDSVVLRGGGTSSLRVKTPDLALGEWCHLAFVLQDTQVMAYTNGALSAKGRIFSVRDNGMGLAFGNNVVKNQGTFKGFFDEIRLCAAAAGADWVQAEHDTVKEPAFLSYSPVHVRENSLLVMGNPGDCGVSSPSFGPHMDFRPGETYRCFCDPAGTNGTGDARFTCTGWRRYQVDPSDAGETLLAEGTSNDFTYVHTDAERLEWLFDRSFLLDLEVVGGGSLSQGDGWLEEGTSATVTAIPAEGMSFSHWSGDVGEIDIHDPVLVLTADRPRRVTATFGRVLHVSEQGDDSADGLGWGSALKTIGRALELAAPADTVLVTNGLYEITSQLTLDKGVRLTSVNGRDVTEILGNGKTRLLYLNHPRARAEGFTLTRGCNSETAPGGGFMIDLDGGTVRHCRVRETKSVWASNTGISVHQKAGLVSSCLIDRNGHGFNQSGTVLVTGGLLENSIIAENVMHLNAAGLWISGGLARNCTITRNRSTGEGTGVYREGDGVLENCIIWGNRNPNAPNSPAREIFGVAPGRVVRCCFPDVGGEGTDSVAEDPLFVDPEKSDFRLRVGSPCIDAGLAGPVDPPVDFAGNGRISGASIDIGALEYDTSVPSCGFHAERYRSSAPLETTLTPVVFPATASVEGLQLEWTFTMEGGEPITRHSTGVGPLPVSLPAGCYDVTLAVTDPATGLVLTESIPGMLVSSPGILYVTASNPSSAVPYGSWESAATNILDAVELAADGATILVSNGLYRIDRQISIDRPLTLESVNGYRETTISAPKTGGVRVLFLNDPGALVKGFTLRDGLGSSGIYGAGVFISDEGGTLAECRVTANNVGSYDSSGAGIRMNAGHVAGCVIDHNALTLDSTQGAGVQMRGGLLENSLIAFNSADMTYTTGGGVALQRDAVVRNCTIVGNSVEKASGVYVNSNAAKVQNCIIRDNVVKNDTTPGAPDWQFPGNADPATVFQGCCTSVAIGTNCITADPIFTDPAAGDFSLRPGSPCIDRGVPLENLAAADLAGNPRLTGKALDIGAYEYDASVASCGIRPVVARAVVPAAIVLSGVPLGFEGPAEGLRYRWTFDGRSDGPPDLDGIGLMTVTNVYEKAGRYDVKLEVSDPAGGQSATYLFEGGVLAAPEVLYVVTENGEAAAPYDRWEIAATNIHEALGWAVGGSRVVVSNGTYLIREPIRLTEDIHLLGFGGFDATVITGDKKDRQRRCRIVELEHPGAVVEGFTLTGGRAPYIGRGSGVNLVAGTLRRCLVWDNADAGYMAGCGISQSGGLVTGCVISNNAYIGEGGGIAIAAGICENSIIVDNRANKGGGVLLSGGLLRNCTVTGNEERNANNLGAGGIMVNWAGTVENCIVWGNKSKNTTGVGAPDWGGNGDASTFFRYVCTSSAVGTNCVVADPCFRDASSGDYRLWPSSPCRDKGLYGEWMEDATDFWGNRRVDRRHYVDIGAFEVNAPLATILLLR